VTQSPKSPLILLVVTHVCLRFILPTSCCET